MNDVAINNLPVNSLGPYPLLQFAAAVLVLAALAFAIYRGSRDRRSPDAAFANEQRYFFDGPMGEALKLLRDLRNIANETRAHVEPLGELGRNAVKELGEIKDKVDDIKDMKSNRRR